MTSPYNRKVSLPWLRIAIFIAVAAAAWSMAAARAEAGDGAQIPKLPKAAIFGSLEFIGGSLRALPQWTRVLAKIEGERSAIAACDSDVRKCPSPAVAAWRASRRSVEGIRLQEQLRELNRFLNNWTYRTDSENYGVEDYWASPLEFLQRSGDCEDYAISKYVTLRELGYPPEKLRIVVLKDILRGVAHAVLAVYLDDKIMIMDSLFDAVLPDTELTFYVPQYSVNEKFRWSHIMPLRPPASAVSGAGPR
jgi:predicted transglutaminase-like cysteine proteinase